jgi:hypothetical protein
MNYDFIDMSKDLKMKTKQLTMDDYPAEAPKGKDKVWEFAVPKYSIRVKCKGNTVYWWDTKGPYSADFETAVEARKGFVYWCRSALAGGELI